MISLDAALLGIIVVGFVVSVTVACFAATVWTLAKPNGKRSRG